MSSGGMQQTGKVESETKVEPWGPQIPHLEKIFGEGENLYDQGRNMYGYQTFAGASPESELAMRAQTGRALSGSPFVNQAQDTLTSTAGGDYLSAGNPYFSQTADTIRANVLPGIDSRFAASGRSGSGLHGRAVGMGLGDAIGALAYKNYGDERTRQMQASAMAPTFAQQDYQDIARLGEVGSAREAWAQKAINEMIQRSDYSQNEPWETLGLYKNAISGNYGGTTTGTQTQYMPSPGIGQGLLGGAASGAGIGAMFGPWGAGIGALGGLALGGLGTL